MNLKGGTTAGELVIDNYCDYKTIYVLLLAHI